MPPPPTRRGRAAQGYCYRCRHPLLPLGLVVVVGLGALLQASAFFITPGIARGGSSRMTWRNPASSSVVLATANGGSGGGGSGGARSAAATATASSEQQQQQQQQQQSPREYVVPNPASEDERVFEVPASVQEPTPLPDVVHRFAFQEFGMSKARKLIRRGQVFVNGSKRTCQDTAVAGDKVEVRAPEPLVKRRDGKPRGVKKIVIIFEDDHLALIVKPAGVAVHGTGAYSLVDRYPEFLAPTSITSRSDEDADGPLAKPVHVHRLDAPVGGLLLVAKTKPALRALTTAFEERRVKKTYRAVVIGRPAAEEGSISDPVDGKEALTRYRVLSSTPSAAFGALSELELYPDTGRKHQLRVHCASGLGTPILGDIRYGPDDTLRTRGLFLFSTGLAFTHPITGEALDLAAPLPEVFGNTVNMERRRKAEAATAEGGGEPAAPGAGDGA